MIKEYKGLKKLIGKNNNILILTHKGPDFDGFCAGLILKKYLNTIYPKKTVSFKTRHYPTQKISFMHEIEIAQTINVGDEELIILVDTGTWDMCTTKDDTIQLTQSKMAIVDHHDTKTMQADVVVNENMSSATEQVLKYCKEVSGKKFKITEGIAFLGQVGIVFDTGRFLYDNTKPETYELMAQLRRIYPVDLENFEYKSTKFPMETLLPLKIYIQNIHIQGDMAYTYITNEDIESNGISKMGLNNAQEFVRDKIIRYIQGVHWGFVVKPYLKKENIWLALFRSTKGYQGVAEIAEALGGGGHQYAAASKIQATNGDDATQKVLQVIEQIVGSDKTQKADVKTTPPSSPQAPSSPSSPPVPSQSL